MEYNGRFNLPDVVGTFTVDAGHTVVTIRGQSKNPDHDVVVVAPVSAQRGTSYSGSGLPYPSYDVARPSAPLVVGTAANGAFECVINYPSAYYVFGKYVPPSFMIGTSENGASPVKVPSQASSVNVGPGVSFRLQNYQSVPDSHVARCNPLFYGNRPYLPNGRTQEQILRDSAYTPYHVPPNFWGLKPAQ